MASPLVRLNVKAVWRMLAEKRLIEGSKYNAALLGNNRFT